MRRLLQAITVCSFLSDLIVAQSPGQGRLPADELLETLRRELAFRELENSRTDVEGQIASRRHALYLERQFIDKMNRFAQLWGALASEYNEKKTFNVKIAGEISKTFHDLENNEGWPKPKAKSRP